MFKLEKILNDGVDEDFPNGSKEPYTQQYPLILKKLKPIQEQSVSGTLLEDIKNRIKKGQKVDPKDLIYLNNHGPAHVACVISRCEAILKAHDCQITGYEAYILLVAINLHDAGLIEGRKDHEKRVFKHIGDLGELMGVDSAEKKLIGKIAAVHGGAINGNKDTIQTLRDNEHILGVEVNPRFLAALVRFSDELADDQTRASRYMLENNLLPDKSKLYHEYSKSLSSVNIKQGCVDLAYSIDDAVAKNTFPLICKDKEPPSDGYLIDEIYIRLVKMYREKIYCMRYLRGRKIEIKKISFRIEGDNCDTPLTPSFTITGTMEECGFPSEPSNGIGDICPSVAEHTGEFIKEKLSRTQ